MTYMYVSFVRCVERLKLKSTLKLLLLFLQFFAVNIDPCNASIHILEENYVKAAAKVIKFKLDEEKSLFGCHTISFNLSKEQTSQVNSFS